MNALPVREICTIGVFCALATELSPRGTVRQILGVLTTAVLLLTLLKGLAGVDLQRIALAREQMREQSESIKSGGEEMRNHLDRLVIQQKLETYITDKAEEMGLPLRRAEVRMIWSSEGAWIPQGASLYGPLSQKEREQLSQVLTGELGIPAGEQYWYDN